MTDRSTELKYRIDAKKKELEQKLAQAKADAHGSKNDNIESLQKKLNELNNSLKNGWDNLTEVTISKLNEWLK